MTGDQVCEAILETINDRIVKEYKEDISLILCGDNVWNALMDTFWGGDPEQAPKSGVIWGIPAKLSAGAAPDSIEYVTEKEKARCYERVPVGGIPSWTEPTDEYVIADSGWQHYRIKRPLTSGE